MRLGIFGLFTLAVALPAAMAMSVSCGSNGNDNGDGGPGGPGPDGSFGDGHNCLGCGDGGLLSLAREVFCDAWGYDFQPSNAAGWAERGVKAYAADVFGADRDTVELGSVVAMTEVLEHLADPHGVLAWVHSRPGVSTLVCSSPVNENGDSHDECNAWAWDAGGYATMVTGAGWTVTDHEIVDLFQVIRAVR